MSNFGHKIAIGVLYHTGKTFYSLALRPLTGPMRIGVIIGSNVKLKYCNPQNAGYCVIPRILSHYVSKSVKGSDLCASLT